MVEVRVAVALLVAAGARDSPLEARHDERRVWKLRDAAGVIVMQVRHDDDRDLLRVDAAVAQLGG